MSPSVQEKVLWLAVSDIKHRGYLWDEAAFQSLFSSVFERDHPLRESGEAVVSSSRFLTSAPRVRVRGLGGCVMCRGQMTAVIPFVADGPYESAAKEFKQCLFGKAFSDPVDCKVLEKPLLSGSSSPLGPQSLSRGSYVARTAREPR